MKKPHINKIKESPWWCCDGATGASPKAAYYAWLAIFNEGTLIKITTSPDEPMPAMEAMSIPRRVGSFAD